MGLLVGDDRAVRAVLQRSEKIGIHLRGAAGTVRDLLAVEFDVMGGALTIPRDCRVLEYTERGC